jgi:hypothetical protein
MDIVDSQVHIGPGSAAEKAAATDSLGIKSALIHDYWMEALRPAGVPCWCLYREETER